MLLCVAREASETRSITPTDTTGESRDWLLTLRFPIDKHSYQWKTKRNLIKRLWLAKCCFQSCSVFTFSLVCDWLTASNKWCRCCTVLGTTEHPDWSFAQRELLDKQGIDLRKEMEARYFENGHDFKNLCGSSTGHLAP